MKSPKCSILKLSSFVLLASLRNFSGTEIGNYGWHIVNLAFQKDPYSGLNSFEVVFGRLAFRLNFSSRNFKILCLKTLFTVARFFARFVNKAFWLVHSHASTMSHSVNGPIKSTSYTAGTFLNNIGSIFVSFVWILKIR